MTGPEPWMQTFTGRQFFPLNGRAEDVSVEDIAHHLSCITRYNGAALSFYSVAQHSVMVSNTCAPQDALWGLLHDAAEAYLGDLTRPIKHSPGMSAFRTAEKRLMLVIAGALNLEGKEPESVKEADAILLATEKRDLLCPLTIAMDDKEWLHGARASRPLSYHIHPWAPVDAEFAFLDRYKELTCRPSPSISTAR